MPFFLQNSFLAFLMLISRKLVQRRGIGEKCGFFSARYSPAVTKVTKGVRSKEGAKSIFTTGLYFLGDSATHIRFYFKQHFFSTICKSLDIPHILASRITFRSSLLNLVLRPPRVRCNCKESGLAPSRASF